MSKFAVFSEDAIVYIGEDPTLAAEAFREKNGVKMEVADSIEELQQRFETHKAKRSFVEEEIVIEEVLSEALENVLDKLDEMGLNPENAEYCYEKARDTGKKVVKNVRHLGHKLMNTAGENFIWLGDLLKEEAKEMESTSECCGNGSCGTMADQDDVP